MPAGGASFSSDQIRNEIPGMPDSARYALHRPEIAQPLQRGEDKIIALMRQTTRRFSAGSTIIQADTEHSLVYRIRSGWAGRIRTLPDGRSQYILIFLPGDLFAVKSMFVTRHMDAVAALSDLTVEQVDQRALRAAYDSDADISLRCSWQLVEEERRLHSWVVSLGRGSASERMAVLLLDFRGRLELSQTIAPQAMTYELPMSQEQIADHLGISAVHVNRVLKDLREANIASVRGRRVKIMDFEALSALAYPLLDTFERSSPAMSYLVGGGFSALDGRAKR